MAHRSGAAGHEGLKAYPRKQTIDKGELGISRDLITCFVVTIDGTNQVGESNEDNNSELVPAVRR